MDDREELERLRKIKRLRELENKESLGSVSEKSLEWSDVPIEAVKHIPRSGAEFAKNIYHAASNPVQTATTLKDVFVGGVQNLLPESLQAGSAEQQRQMASAVGKFFVDRYGSMEGLKQTIANDPVGFLADLSVVLSGGGALAAKLPGYAGKAGKVISTAGHAVDPMALTIKAAKPVVQTIGKGASNVLGGIGTHTGGQSIQTAAKAGYKGGRHADDFLSNLRGQISAEDAVLDAKRAVSVMAKERASAYKAGMAGVKADTKILDFSPIHESLKDLYKMGSYKGHIISESAAKTLDQIAAKINEWSSAHPRNFHTAEGLDALKKAIGEIREKTDFRTLERAMADRAYNVVKNEITKQAPQYAKVMRGYEQASKQIREIEKGLSLGDKASVDTALRKLQSVMRNNANTNYGNRVRMAQTLENAGAETLMDKLAGQSLSTFTPRGLGNIQAGGTAIGAAATTNPWLLGLLIPQSPRLMGEAVYYGAKAARPITEAGKMLAPYSTPAFQAGRINDLAALLASMQE